MVVSHYEALTNIYLPPNIRHEFHTKGHIIMGMTPRERIMAVLNGEEPDRIPVCVVNLLLPELPGGWCQRLAKRGMGIFRWVLLYKPGWSPDAPGVFSGHAYLKDVKYTQVYYIEKGIKKYRHTFETPVGSITGVVAVNPLPHMPLVLAQEEYLVKQPSDWRVVNFIFKTRLDNLAPDYEAIKIAEDELGDAGIAVGFSEQTAWQKAWTHLAPLERAVIDFHEQPEEVQEFIETEKRLHTRIAEFVAECPAKFIDIGENITDVTSPKYYRAYCLPIYEIYSKQLEGTGKVLGVHMDGRLGRLKKEIAETLINLIESFAVPPTGEVSLTEVRKIWPDKMIIMNTACHLAWAEPEEVRKGYEALLEEWGSKKGLILELSEHLPLETVEAHLSAAMDVFGY